MSDHLQRGGTVSDASGAWGMNPSKAGRTAQVRRSIQGPVSVLGIAVAAIAAACAGGSTPTPAATGTAPTEVLASASPSPSLSVEVSAPATVEPLQTPGASDETVSGESASPTGSPVANETPSPTPSPAAGWTTPVAVGPAIGANGPYCDGLITGIDSSSREHLAESCGGRITYAVASPGGSWATVSFAPPAHRIEMGPELAFRGNLVYLAYTRIAIVEGGCGDNGLRDVGVYYRTRQMPDGAWSAPIRLGAVDDGIESFRVAGSTIYATVANRTSGDHFFEVSKSGVTKRYRLADATGAASLRVGVDGKARIVYPSAKALRYAVFTGSGLTTTSIPKTTSRAGQPQLVLGSGDVAAVAWLSMDQGGGCAIGEEPSDGLYVGTEHGTSWTTLHLGKNLGAFSLQVDPTTGRIALLQAADAGFVLHTMDPGGPWVTSVVLPSNDIGEPQLRLDPANGSLMVAWIGAAGTYVMRHP